MPQAVPMVVGFAASQAAIAITAETAFAITAGSFTSMAIGAVASYAASSLMKSAESAPTSFGATSATPEEKTVQYRNPVAAHDVVVGRTKKSGPIVFLWSGDDDDGRAFGYFYQQIVLASHEVEAIQDIYFDNILSTDAKYTGLTYVGKHLGTTAQTEDTTFLSDLGSDFTDHWLKGRANIAVRLKGSSTAFPSGVPSISAIVWGSNQIYDPRTGTTGWHNNAILILLWWMMWGEGYELADFDSAALEAAANICDERVRVRVLEVAFTVSADFLSIQLPVGARALDVGDGVRVTGAPLPAGLSANTTYYICPIEGGLYKLCTSVANAFAGTGINLVDAGTTTFLTYWDEARYKCNGSFSLDAEKADIRDQLKTACAGEAVEIGGIWFLSAGAAVTPVTELTIANLRDAITIDPKRSLAERYNGVRCVFVDADNSWERSDAPVLLNSTYLATDEGAELYLDLNLPYVTSARQAQRLMNIALERSRSEGAIKWPTNMSGLEICPMDGVYVTIERFNWTREQYQNVGWLLAPDGGIDLLLQKDRASIYDWDAETQEQFTNGNQVLTFPDPSAIAAPTTLTVTAPATAVFSTINVTWAEVKNIYIGGYTVEYRTAGDTDWVVQVQVGATAPREVIAISLSSLAFDFRVAATTDAGVSSTYKESLAPAIATSITATGGAAKIDLAWTNGAGYASVVIFYSASNDPSTAEVLTSLTGTSYSHTGLGAAQTVYYWIRTISSSGNFSNLAGSVNATTNP